MFSLFSLNYRDSLLPKVKIQNEFVVLVKLYFIIFPILQAFQKCMTIDGKGNIL